MLSLWQDPTKTRPSGCNLKRHRRVAHEGAEQLVHVLAPTLPLSGDRDLPAGGR